MLYTTKIETYVFVLNAKKLLLLNNTYQNKNEFNLKVRTFTEVKSQTYHLELRHH